MQNKPPTCYTISPTPGVTFPSNRLFLTHLSTTAAPLGKFSSRFQGNEWPCRLWIGEHPIGSFWEKPWHRGSLRTAAKAECHPVLWWQWFSSPWSSGCQGLHVWSLPGIGPTSQGGCKMLTDTWRYEVSVCVHPPLWLSSLSRRR